MANKNNMNGHKAEHEQAEKKGAKEMGTMHEAGKAEQKGAAKPEAGKAHEAGQQGNKSKY